MKVYKQHLERAIFLSLVISMAVAMVSCKDQKEVTDDTTVKSDSLIFPKGNKITNDNFTGAAYLQMLINADSLNPVAVGNVTFDAGARTKWHLHPDGQILLATDGIGYYQEKGMPKRIFRKGDVIKCPPNTLHWHGASPNNPLVQLAITAAKNGTTQWFEEVAQQEYIAPVNE